MRGRRETRAALLFILPWVVGFCVFLLYPLLASIYYSFCDYSVLKPPIWIGAANYVDLWHDEVFFQTIWNTLIYAAMALPLGLLLALGLALLLNAKVRGMTVYRTIFFVPSLVPAVALAVLWLWIFNGDDGILNYFIRMIHYPALSLIHHGSLQLRLHWKGVSAPNWTGDTLWSKPALVLMSLWGTGNAVVIYLAGLQDVPQALYEAAELDGAGWWARTRNVTLPMLSPVILFNLIMGIIGTLQVFTVPYVMFPGGTPARSTYFYTMYLFDNAFIYHKMGYACAMGWLMFLAVLLLTLGAIKLSERHVYYGGA
ncbi:MAG TPA: sugar ABC transporter permease [Chthonomonadales bacterium]|nr:sugar ABC transporter permease [Chthonomonadales bacterium]